MDEKGEWLSFDYEQTLETYRQLVEIRFKLLAFVPTISGGAIALLTQTRIERSEKLVLALLGLLVTLGSFFTINETRSSTMARLAERGISKRSLGSWHSRETRT
jgi:hypothetical protein